MGHERVLAPVANFRAGIAISKFLAECSTSKGDALSNRRLEKR
jgi:hypothetical protein